LFEVDTSEEQQDDTLVTTDRIVTMQTFKARGKTRTTIGGLLVGP
jgi:hypothetical protein